MDDQLRKIVLTNGIFTSAERTRLRSELLDRAVNDRRISGCAITGSAATGHEDEWSDIDLAFGIVGGLVVQVLSDWTAHMYEQHGAVHHVDTRFGAWIYRSFLLPSTLQVDLAFAPSTEFRPLGATFHVVFGAANELALFDPPKAVDIAARCLPAVHCARVCITNGDLWQAEHFLSTARDNALASACLRHDLPWHHGRGFDLLPTETKAVFEDTFPPELCTGELSRALDVLVRSLDGEEPSSGSCANSLLLEPDYGIGLGWLYAVHVRSCIRRQRLWQAEYMIRGVRDNALGLACFRCGKRLDLGRRPDALPNEIRLAFQRTWVRSLQADELARAAQSAVQQLVSEISLTQLPCADRLEKTLTALSESMVS